MENKEGILLALKSLDKDNISGTPAILEEYIREIAKHGLTFIPWIHIKPLILRKFNQVLDVFFEELDDSFRPRLPGYKSLTDLRQHVYECLMRFEGTPFTIQRLCELLTQPRKHYTRPDKYLRGFEKACLVVSTVDCFGKKIHHIDPRFSGDVGLDDSSTVNESFTTGGSSGSNDESISLPKRSDEEDDEEDEDGFVKTSERAWATTRPRINFHRPLMSSLSIPPADTGELIQRDTELPHLNSPVKQNQFHPSPNSDISGEGSLKNSHSYVMDGEQDDQVLTIQKLFAETDTPDLDLSKPMITASVGSVPPIDQMLRPMGQLEAFVNTISMDSTATESTPLAMGQDFTTISRPESSFTGKEIGDTMSGTPTVEPASESAESIFTPLEDEVTDTLSDNAVPIETSACEVIPEEEKTNDCAEIEIEKLPSPTEQPTSVSHSARLSTKRESPIFDDNDDDDKIGFNSSDPIDSGASPAKRLRLLPDLAANSLPSPPKILPTDIATENELQNLPEESPIDYVEAPQTSAPQEAAITLDQESGERVKISLELINERHSPTEPIQRDSETGEQESS